MKKEDTVDEKEIQILLNYPLLSRTVKDNKVTYDGLIEVDKEDYKISIQEHPQAILLTLPPNLKHLEAEFSVAMKQQGTKDVLTYLDSLKTFIRSKVPSKDSVNYCEIYRIVLHEYFEITRFYLNLKTCRLARDLSKINVSTLDEQNREHCVEISVNYGREDTFQIVDFDLPQESDSFKASASLREVYDQFCQVVDALQPFFRLMEVFDSHCDILDPVPPKRRYNYRRIWIGENVSLIVIVDPMNVSRMPEIKFLGPERLIESYRSTINENLENWDQNNDTFSEILKLIGIEAFPRKHVSEVDGDDMLMMRGDCSICFSLRLNDKLPEVICKNQFCENCYHVECLYEWLMSVNARRFFTEVIGNCPNCEKTISCPIPG